MSYDIIGDVHGHADKLELLLAKLGYSRSNGCWRHPRRKAIFLGDFIDRGPAQLQTVDIARRMVTEGAALAVMGNHELNAIAWYTPDPRHSGECLRPHCSKRWGSKNYRQHRLFLKELGRDAVKHAEIIAWFKTLPLWLEMDGIRIVHACWHQRFMEGVLRDRARVSWWKEGADTYRTGTDLPEAVRIGLPDAPLPVHTRIAVPTDRPIFFGHYCRPGSPSLDSGHFACVDFCAGKGGPLAAYRWDGESTLSAKNFVSAE